MTDKEVYKELDRLVIEAKKKLEEARKFAKDNGVDFDFRPYGSEESLMFDSETGWYSSWSY